MPAAKTNRRSSLHHHPRRVLEWKLAERLRNPFISQSQRIIARQINEDIKAAAKAAAEKNTVDDMAEAAALEIDQRRPLWIPVYRRVYLPTVANFGTRVLDGLKSSLAHEIKQVSLDNLWFGTVSDYLATFGGEKIVGITNTTKKKIRKAIQTGVAAGETVRQIELRIAAASPAAVTRARAHAIARTEITAASSLGSEAAAEITGLALERVWLATPGARTRESHAAADGQRVAMKVAFTVGGAELMYPGDAAAPAAEIVNCRCVVAYEEIGG